jgi:hypothetical protein
MDEFKIKNDDCLNEVENLGKLSPLNDSKISKSPNPERNKLLVNE